jgi:hypothetical protein
MRPVTMFMGAGVYKLATTRKQYDRLKQEGGIGLGAEAAAIEGTPRHGETGIILR